MSKLECQICFKETFSAVKCGAFNNCSAIVCEVCIVEYNERKNDGAYDPDNVKCPYCCCYDRKRSVIWHIEYGDINFLRDK